MKRPSLITCPCECKNVAYFHHFSMQNYVIFFLAIKFFLRHSLFASNDPAYVVFIVLLQSIKKYFNAPA